MNASATHEIAAKGSSFHKAMLLMPKTKRKAMLILYAVCRALDDAVDDAPIAADAIHALALWEKDMEAIFIGNVPHHALAQDFAEIYRHYQLQPDDMRAMLAALSMDAQQRMCHPSMAELEQYCYGVAGAVGLMSMQIFGCNHPDARLFAVALGHALQLTNILRDVRIDATMGRIYLPHEFLASTITTQKILLDPTVTHSACAKLGALAHARFMEAEALANHLPTRTIAPALAMRDVYALYWCKLAAQDWRAPLSGKITLNATEKAKLATRASGYMLGKYQPVILNENFVVSAQ
ncbi:MAG: phytoene/squalene synthase family protein [Alphaproteobacteria bacterium]|nr:phytoene/squalene synthase family protein [Alphaproteobacteria bacterium]